VLNRENESKYAASLQKNSFLWLIILDRDFLRLTLKSYILDIYEYASS